MAFLMGMSDAIKGQKFEIKRDRTTIGRSHNNDIVLNDGAVSSQHCYVSHRGNRYVLHDLNSTNGTKLNFETVTEVELQPKQVIQIGAIELMFDGDSSEFSSSSTVVSPEVIVVNTPTATTAPKSFSSVSPFGRRHEEHKVVWLIGIALVAFLALVGIVYFIYKIIF